MADQQQPGGGEQQPAQPLWPAAYGQAASFKFQHIPPPSESYFSLNDRLIIRITDPFYNTPPLTIAGRILRMDGQIVPFSEDFLPKTGGFGPFDFSVQVGEGFLLDVAVHTAPNVYAGAEVYVQILRTLSVGATQVIIGPMAAGYLNSDVPIGWPPINYERPGSGAGNITAFTANQPPAGQEVYVSALQGMRIRIASVVVTLTTSAATANRVVSFVWTDGFNEMFRSTATVAQTASTTWKYVGIAGLGAPYQSTVGNQVRNFLPLPSTLIIGSTHRLTTQTDNLQAGDQWSYMVTGAEIWAVDM